MLSKEDIKVAILKECQICRRLFEEVDQEQLQNSLGENMWNLQELLATLSFIGIYTAEALKENDFIDKEHSRYEKMKSEAFAADWNSFPSLMEKQEKALSLFFENLSEDDLKKEAYHPLINHLPLNQALLEITLKFMVGYRMQLFLYLKANGKSELNGALCWSGIEEPYYSYR
ncbi:hypothetical protein [Sediminitomix flava]|uniref:DinB family protein n=1 Tax=Sediminitomix flava TaxID=379075 RepID=A0A315Z8T2_SEDFL|nr:hypothetical protein [Sediminitomix flava]PWJ41068.1 hypothetical protein BC781_104343 [Sediminitomix flava]